MVRRLFVVATVAVIRCHALECPHHFESGTDEANVNLTNSRAFELTPSSYEDGTYAMFLAGKTATEYGCSVVPDIAFKK
jgi:hypothetical protein